jgi:hypothetical protein
MGPMHRNLYTLLPSSYNKCETIVITIKNIKRLYLLIILLIYFITLTLTILDLLRIKILSALRSYTPY